MNWLDQPDMAWQDHAACRGEDPDLWFPPNGSYTVANTQPARFICLDCPAYDACWDWATPRLGLDGIWAGTTPEERKHIRATNNITAIDDNLDRILDLHPNTPEPEEDHAA